VDKEREEQTMAKLATSYAPSPLTAKEAETAISLIGEILEITDNILNVVDATKDHIFGSMPCPCGENPSCPDGLLSMLRMERAKLGELQLMTQEVRDSIY
jgi:hypothetical protein